MAELLDQTVLGFKGPVIGKTSYAAMAGAKLQYIGNTFAASPVEWNPVLLHSPSGQVGDLWAVSTDLNFVLRHRGQLWARQTFQADNVSTGQDGTMMIASAGGIWRWDESQKQVNNLADLANLIQVEVGNAKHVWGRCTDNTVHTFDTTKNTFNLTTIVRAMDIAANADGTLWHCHDEAPNTYRFISEATLPSAKLPLGHATVTGVHRWRAPALARRTAWRSSMTAARRSIATTRLTCSRPRGPLSFTPICADSGIVAGLGNLYFISSSGVFSLDLSLVAVDAHTGREVKRLQLFASTKRKALFKVSSIR